MPERLDDASPPAVDLVRRQRHLPKNAGLAATATRVPSERLLVETDAPYLAPQSRPRPAERAGVRHETGFVHRAAARHQLRRVGGHRRGERRVSIRLVSEAHQPTLRRMAQFGVRPRRSLGQNFLVDSNILGVIGRAAELQSADVVLEIGGGLGRPVGVSRGTRRLSPCRRAGRRAGASPPRRPWAVRSQQHAPSDRRYAARPGGSRAAAVEDRCEPAVWNRRGRHPAHDRGDRHGVVMARDGPAGGGGAICGDAGNSLPIWNTECARPARVRRARRSERSAERFYPVPRVDSVLLRLVRRGPAPPPELRAFVRAAFAHRRKTLASSVAQSGGIAADRVRAALAAIGKPPALRAESLSPAELRSCGNCCERARAGEDQPLPLCRPAALRRVPRARQRDAGDRPRRRAGADRQRRNGR